MNLLLMMICMYFMSCLLLTIMYNHLLMSLMSLEIMMLSLMLMTYMFMLMLNFEYFLLFYLVFIVCEGVLGLTLLILLIRFKGMDKLYLLNLLLW
nr:NADH dehydrogenase subunit 4L [Parnips nigripes]